MLGIGLSFAGVLLCFSGCGGRKETSAETGGGNGKRAFRVYVPCGMEMPFMELCDEFEKQHPGVDVTLTLDNSNVLALRVTEKNERPDIMVSPGSIEMQQLLDKGFVVPGDLTRFGKYELVLFGPRANPGKVSTFGDLEADSVKAIAVADPETTSVGYYTRETLRNLGLWDKVQNKVVFTADPSMAYKHVAREKAQASFAYRSCPLKTAPDKLEYSKVRIIESVPGELYGPAYASIAVLKDSPNRDLGAAFVKLVVSDKGQALLAKYEVPCLDSLGTAGSEE
jgi:molybdate transport system substrate-binding protein